MDEKHKLILKSAGMSLCVTTLMVIGYWYNASKKPPNTYNDVASSNVIASKDTTKDTTNDQNVTESIPKINSTSPVAPPNSDMAQKKGNIYQLNEEGFDDYQAYINKICAYEFEDASDIALKSSNPIMQSLFQDSAMLIYMSQLKTDENEAEISKKLRNDAIKNPINFFVCAMYINSYDRTPLIYAKDSINPEFDVLGDLVIEPVEDTYAIGDAEQVYHATFTLDGYKMDAIFYAKDIGYAIYKITSLEEVPYLTVERFEQIRGAYSE